MRASSIIISGLLGLGVTATSFTSTGTLDGGFSIPDDIPDGVYSISYDDSGLAVHTAIEDLEVRDIGAVPSIETRDRAGGATLGKRDWYHDCGGIQNMDHGATDRAVDSLKWECGGGKEIGVGERLYGISSGGGQRVVAFFCLFSHRGNRRSCYSDEAAQRFASITNVCGWYVSGWTDWWSGSTKEYTYGYHVLGDNNNFCGRA
ncbi:hypothetical protein CGCSCA1_v011637 [Colletotrichum siamense]|nr:hypothetical protein CGCSCA1_v011637 [Colletotrichum siamense]